MERNTINLFFFNLINSLAQFLVIIILSRYCTVEDYSIYRKVFLPFEIVSPLIGLGLSSTIFYFYPRFENKKQLIVINIILLFIASLIFEFFLVGTTEIFNSANENHFKYYLYTGIFSFFSLSNTVLYSFLILENKTKINIYVNFISNLLQIILLLLIVVYFNNLHLIFGLRICVYAFTFLIILIKLGLISFHGLSLANIIFESKKILKHSIPLSLSLMVGVLSYQLDKFIISKYCDSTTFAIYMNGAFEVPLVAIVTSSLAGASFGLFTEFCIKKDFISASALLNKITIVSALVIFPSFVFLYFYAQEFIEILFGVKYKQSHEVFRIFLLLLPIRIIQYGNILIALGKTKILLLRSAIELFINLIVGITLFNYIGYIGIAYGTVVAVLFFTVPFNMKLIAKGFSTSLTRILPYKKLFYIMICCLLALGIVNEIHHLVNLNFNNLLVFSFAFILFSTVFIGFVFLFKIISINLNTNFKFKINC